MKALSHHSQSSFKHVDTLSMLPGSINSNCMEVLSAPKLSFPVVELQGKTMSITTYSMELGLENQKM